MSIVDPSGKQISDGPTGRKITVHEHILKGRPCWGMEVTNDLDALETILVLTEVTRAVVLDQKNKMMEHRVKQEVQQKLNDLTKGVKE